MRQDWWMPPAGCGRRPRPRVIGLGAAAEQGLRYRFLVRALLRWLWGSLALSEHERDQHLGVGPVFRVLLREHGGHVPLLDSGAEHEIARQDS